jgi:hypothetical protein
MAPWIGAHGIGMERFVFAEAINRAALWQTAVDNATRAVFAL